jgi:hypothetical protein
VDESVWVGGFGCCWCVNVRGCVVLKMAGVDVGSRVAVWLREWLWSLYGWMAVWLCLDVGAVWWDMCVDVCGSEAVCGRL